MNVESLSQNIDDEQQYCFLLGELFDFQCDRVPESRFLSGSAPAQATFVDGFNDEINMKVFSFW